MANPGPYCAGCRNYHHGARCAPPVLPKREPPRKDGRPKQAPPPTKRDKDNK